MKEFIIKNDDIELPELEKTFKDFDFITNDDNEGVSVSRVGFKFGGLPKIIDNRIKKDIIYSDIKEYDITHRNYFKYLDDAYSYDCGLVIKPDFIWFTILCELSLMIKKEPEQFRDYFSYTVNQQKIKVHSDKFGKLPVEKVLKKVMERIPSNLTEDLIVPNFSTKDKNSEFAFKAAFLDAVSPFYYYGVMYCGYNKIKILGEQKDYLLISETLTKITEIIPNFNEYNKKVKSTINEIIHNWDNIDYWKEICKTETNYGRKIVDGWFKNFYMLKDNKHYNDHAMVDFPEHLTKVDYSDELGNEYSLYVGILSSKLENGYLIPSFNKIVAQKQKIEQCQEG